MAATYPPSFAFDESKSYIKYMDLETVQVRILDDVCKMIWMEAPWRWTVSQLEPTTLISDTQDYLIDIPSDFLYVLYSYISDGADVFRALHVAPFLVEDGPIGQPSQMALINIDEEDLEATLRLFPTPGTLPTPAKILYSWYKKKAPVMNETSIYVDGALVMDDEWFSVFQAGVLWQAYKYADDQRAGGVQFNAGKASYTGQAGEFFAGLDRMREREKLGIFDKRLAPEPIALAG